jgi:uncharacterized membrane protein YphA (DoxX/SURF4 family)
MNRVLWIVQILLALVFLFAGVVKFVIPVDQMTKQMPLSGGFIHFVAVAELLGALGLILPLMLGIRPGLTPLAAACLFIVMIGATAVTWQTQPGPGVAIPGVTGVLCAFVAYGRWRTVRQG